MKMGERLARGATPAGIWFSQPHGQVARSQVVKKEKELAYY